jgi:IS605 OrfB family transposase
MILTYQYRIKDASTAAYLARHSSAVNFVWNYCCEIQREAQRRHYGDKRVRWPSAFDLCALTTGCAAELGLHSDTVNGICRQFAKSRDKTRRCPRWRSYRKSLPWIPINAARAIKIENGRVRYLGRWYRYWDSRPIDGKVKTAAFCADARRRWYINIVVEIEEAAARSGSREVGIDLGLKNFAVLSTGKMVAAPRIFRKYEARLAVAQRAGNKDRARAIHAKVDNARRDFLHKLSTQLVIDFDHIAVGNVNAKGLAQTRLAKSVLDAGWSAFRGMLRYKAVKHGATFEEVCERFTTQSCSSCGARSGPKGIPGLGIRQWTCSECGIVHHRDLNASLNILAGAEHRPLAGEIPAPQGVGRC